MNRHLIRVDLDPAAWRSQPAVDPTHRRHKRHLSLAQFGFVAGLFIGALVGAVLGGVL